MISDHACTGAECPLCSPFALPRIACQQCGILLLSRERWSWMQGGRELSPLCRPCYEERQAQRLRVQEDLPPSRREKLATFQDARGKPVTRWPTQSKASVTAVIWDPGHLRMLWLMRRDNGLWVFPGGSHEPGETLGQAVQREVWEETGLHVEPDALVCVDADPTQYALNAYPDHLVHYVALTFACHAFDTDYTLNHESLMAQWCPASAPPIPTAPAHYWRWQHALLSQGGIPWR